ncbi:MAG: PqiC family protein [Candidatus Cloacimonetes bacterium]|nr:PqiC family protein [Candidatus Cloacimonadota bacterium]
MKVKILSLLILILVVLGCSTKRVERKYYIIDYNPVAKNPNLILSTPLPYKVQIPDSRISRVYDRTQVVFRYSAHRIEYSANDLWAVRLSSAIPDILIKHFIQYNIFSVTQRDFVIERPDYEVITFVNRLELLKSDYYKAIYLDMDIFLRRGSDLVYLVRHTFHREHEVYSDDVEIFVQNLSRIIKEETDIFIEKVLNHFEILIPENSER